MSKTRHAPAQGDEHLLVRSYAVTHPRNLGVTERSHPDWDQVAFASRGVMTVTTPEGTWVVPPHRAVWIPAGATYSVRTTGRVSLRTLFLRPALARGRLPRTCVALNVSALVRELVLHAVRRNTLRRDAPADRRLAAVIVDQLATSPQAPLQLPMPADRRARTAAAAAQEDPSLAAKTLARSAGASARTLERLFLRDTGMPFGRWRRRARLVGALRLLAGGATVTQAALEVGYQTPSAFIAAFRRELGTTPGRYFGRTP
ncbi:MAG: helix-turn-helix transcriptional regulator [Vicinamibacterales bacterium]